MAIVIWAEAQSKKAMLIDVEFIPTSVALVGSCIAVYTDMRRRIIPNELNYAMIAFGVGFYLILGLWLRDLFVSFFGVFGAAISFIIGYLLWRTGGWAGGDVKLYTALGSLLYGYQMPTGNPIYPMPLTILFNSIIAVLPVLLIYFVVLRAQGKSAFYDRVRITELKEGMIPAETIFEKKGKICRSSAWFSLKKDWDRVYTNPRRAAGLTRHQIRVLKKLVRDGKIGDNLRIKKGMPFAPSLAAGVFVTVIFGDLYWRFMLWLLGYV